MKVTKCDACKQEVPSAPLGRVILEVARGSIGNYPQSVCRDLCEACFRSTFEAVRSVNAPATK